MGKLYDLWGTKEFRPYLGEVKRKFGIVETLALPSMRDLPPVQIETLFVPPLLAKKIVNPDSDPDNWPEGESLTSIMETDRQLVVLGDPGGGKTTLSNWLAWRLTAGISAPLPDALANKLPLPCILREMPSTCFEGESNILSLSKCILRTLLLEEKVAAVANLFTKWIENGQFVLILDGIDEIPIAQRKIVANWIRESKQRGASVLATSRIVGYEDYPVDSLSLGSDLSDLREPTSAGDDLAEPAAMRRIFQKRKDVSTPTSLNTQMNDNRWAKVRYLMPFDAIRISDFAHNWYRQRCITSREAKQKTQDLLAALSLSEVTQKLARTPNLLSLMAIVHRERAHLPDGKALLYDEIVNAYLNTIDKQRKIGSDDILSQYGWKDRQSWISYVAFKMQERRSPWRMKDSSLLATETEVLYWLTTSIAESGIASSELVAKDFLQWVARRSGLLLPRGEGQYAFVHLSFQEYFSARFLESSIVRPAFVKNKLPAGSPVTKARLRSWANSYPWLETLIFLFELLSIERDSDWVEDLTNIVFHKKLDHNLMGTMGSLAARMIKNKHIKTSEDIYERLVNACSAAACSEWEEGPESNYEILKTLVNSGHAILIANTNEEETAALGQAFTGKNLLDECEKSKIRVILIRDSEIDLSSHLGRFPNLLALVVDNLKELNARSLKDNNVIRILHLSNTKITNFSSLTHNNTIQHLEMHYIKSSNFNSLDALNNIRTLVLSGLKLNNIDFCKKMPYLIYVRIADAPINTLAPLANSKYLREIQIESLNCTDVDFLESTTGLASVRIIETPVRSLPNLSTSDNLTSLSLRGTNINDLSPIQNHPSLRILYIKDSPIKEIHCLKDSPKLEILMLYGLPMHNALSISQCIKIKSLHLANMPIGDLTPLSAMKNLRALIITDLPVKDVSPLVKLKKISYLQLADTDILDVTPLGSMKSLDILRIDERPDLDLSYLKTKENLRIIPVDIELE